MDLKVINLVVFLVIVATINGVRVKRGLFSLAPTKPRIIGGEEAVPHSYPYQVGLLINKNAFCGGSLISPNYVLTAAHCGVLIHSVDVILGAHNITNAEADQVHIPGEKVINHEQYNSTTFQNDIALIKLSKPVPIGEYINTIRLPSLKDANKTYLGEITTATGWGLAGDVSHHPTLGDISDVLRVVEVAVLENDSCGQFYNEPEDNYYYVTDLNICTSGYKNKGTCEGDSGGPLVYRNTLIGIVSIGTDLCEVCSPSIFTSVGKFLTWIGENSDVTLH